MKTRSTTLVLLLALAYSGLAQVPHIINYQGRVVVGRSNFDGTGQFKFSLVNSNGSVTFWSNDGSGVNGGEPNASVPIVVDHGAYSVGLGDTSLRNMTPIRPTVFLNSDVRLRVWFSDGGTGFEQLTPDQRITSVGYAMVANSVPDGSITADKLAPGAALANLGGASTQAGTVTLSSDGNSATLLNAGFVKIGDLAVGGERWDNRATFLSARGFGAAVWTGTEMLVWGGGNFDFFNDGGRYDPGTDSWQPMSSSNAPSARWFPSYVWTGREMIIWGGRANFFAENHNVDGGRYNPRGDRWTTMSTDGAPTPRSQCSAVWTGSELLIWGGMIDGNTPVNTGARYDPSTDTWTAMSTNGAPSPRVDHGAVWAGREMIVWGGWNIPSDVTYADGARYNPATDTWRPVSVRNAPPAVHWVSSVWTGTEMVIWGGRIQPDNEVVNVGGRYDPATDTWKRTSMVNAAQARAGHSTVWTGTEMIVWGGTLGGGLPEINTGGRYNPAADAWAAMTTQNAPQPRGGHTAVWTGRGMLICNGYQNHPTFEHYDSNTLYVPGKTVYVYQKP